MMLYAFHQGGYQDGQLWYSTYVPGSGWQPDALTSLQRANGLSMYGSPSAVEYGGNLYAFTQSAADNDSDSQLLYQAYNGVTWGANTVQGVMISQSPSAVIWNGRLHVFYQGPNPDSSSAEGDGTPHFTYFDGTNWQPDQQVPNVGMSGSPSAVVWNGDLHVFHQGAHQSGQLWYSAYVPGSGWQPDQQVPNVGMSGSPSAVVYGGKLYVFHQGADQNGQLWYSTYVPGSGWQPDTQVPNVVGISESPSAVVWNGDLHVFHQGIGEDGQLWFAYFDGAGWKPDQQVQNVGMSESPWMLATA